MCEQQASHVIGFVVVNVRLKADIMAVRVLQKYANEDNDKFSPGG